MSLGLESGAVRVVRYDAAWPAMFLDEAKRIRNALGVDIQLEMEHTGSTAVPGLCAKPVLDILAGWRTGDTRERVVAALESAGYLYRGEQGIPGRDFFRRGQPRAYHIHLVEFRGPFWREHLAFRDALRADNAIRDGYSALKLGLAQRFPRDREAYIEGKSGFIEKIVTETLAKNYLQSADGRR